MPDKIGNLSDLARGLFLGVLAHSPGWRPQDDVVLAQDGQCLRVGRHAKVAAADREVGFAGAQQGQGFSRSPGRDRGEPDRPAFVAESLCHRLDYLMIVAACGSDGDPEGLEMQGVEEGGPKDDKSQSQHDQQPSSSSIVSTPVEIGC